MVHPRLKLLLTVLLGTVLAVAVGSDVASGSYLWPTLTLAAGATIFLAWSRWPASALVLSLLLFGYIVGNRGFAQLYLANLLPILPAEFGLVVCGMILVAQSAQRRELPLKRDLLNGLVLAWLLFGAARLAFDIRGQGLAALRDSAMVYYALFFFLGQALGAEAVSRRWLLRGLGAALAILPVCFVAFDAEPAWFYTHLVIRDVPLILYKGDIAASCLGAGVFFFYHYMNQGRRLAWLAMLGCFAGAVFPLTRAALVGMACAALIHVLARRWRMLLQLGLATVVLGAASLAWTASQGRPVTESRAFQVIEYATTTLNISGTGTLTSYSGDRDVKGNPIDNNQFRLVWWETVTSETIRENPWFGVGFGYDLAREFLMEYGLMADTEFNTRSPHSFVVNTFARLGVAGLVVLLALLAAMATETWRAAQAWREDAAASEAPALWAMCWVLFISACFGVVLEGPMGAVVFWTILGLAHSTPAAAPADLHPGASADEVAASP